MPESKAGQDATSCANATNSPLVVLPCELDQLFDPPVFCQICVDPVGLSRPARVAEPLLGLEAVSFLGMRTGLSAISLFLCALSRSVFAST